ncbi:hypothetical protein ABIA45_000269 [Bradyrhizobium sp. USDA 336]
MGQTGHKPASGPRFKSGLATYARHNRWRCIDLLPIALRATEFSASPHKLELSLSGFRQVTADDIGTLLTTFVLTRFGFRRSVAAAASKGAHFGRNG